MLLMSLGPISMLLMSLGLIRMLLMRTVCFRGQVMEAAGHSARAIRLTFVGEMGWELHIPNHSAVPVYTAVMEAGKKHGIVNAGYRAIDSLSIEKGAQ